MWYNFRVVLSWSIGIIGILIILGTAGADCDGKCMDNALTLSEMLAWFGYGLAAITTAICIHPISR